MSERIGEPEGQGAGQDGAQPEPGSSGRRRPSYGALGTVAAIAAVLGGAAYWYQTRVPKRFGVVAPGKLYRSGEMTPRQLEYIKGRYNIQRVISMLDPSVPESVAERQAAERLGIEWHNVPLRGNGASTPEKRDELRALVLDEDAGPTLVHCAAGVNRTGLAVGMYRIHQQGWTYDQVMIEMLDWDFDNLPKHENLRDALREEARLARERFLAATTQRAGDATGRKAPSPNP